MVLGTGDSVYEDSFRYYENTYKGSVCSNIMYDETRAHKIYAGADALLVPSQFEPCGLTQLIAMHYGTIPIVRETGGLKDTVEPYNMYYNTGNGFTFDKYDAGLLLDAINRAKTLYFTTAGAGMRWFREIWPKTSPGITQPGSIKICIWSWCRNLVLYSTTAKHASVKRRVFNEEILSFFSPSDKLASPGFRSLLPSHPPG